MNFGDAFNEYILGIPPQEEIDKIKTEAAADC